MLTHPRNKGVSVGAKGPGAFGLAVYRSVYRDHRFGLGFRELGCFFYNAR